MSRMRKMLWAKLGLASEKEGGHEKEEDVNSLMGKANVNEEYAQAFRTKSYVDMFNKLQGQLETRTSFDQEQSSSSSTTTTSTHPSPPPLDHHQNLEYFLEPRQETLTSTLESLNLHHFLVNYFEISLEASKTCECILHDAQQLRINHRSIQNVVQFIKQVPDTTDWTHTQYQALYRNLESVALHRNPFSSSTQEKFHELHDNHSHLLHQLTSQCRKTKRRTRFIRCIKRALATLLVVGSGALAVVFLVLLIHSMIGIVAALPGFIICTLAIFLMKKLKQAKKKAKKTSREGLGAQLDTAARGVYILINDFDTMSRIVQTLNDEMEHRKFVADVCVRKGKNEMLKEVAREFQMHESCFLEQLEELEKQIYLCFLDINRSRRLVVQEMVNC